MAQFSSTNRHIINALKVSFVIDPELVGSPEVVEDRIPVVEVAIVPLVILLDVLVGLPLVLEIVGEKVVVDSVVVIEFEFEFVELVVEIVVEVVGRGGIGVRRSPVKA